MTILHILKWWSNGKKLANFFSLHLSSIKCVRIAIYYCAIWISHPNSVDAPVADSADCTKKMLFSDCKIISQVKICKNNEINTGFSISYIRFFNQRKDSMDHKVTKKTQQGRFYLLSLIRGCRNKLQKYQNKFKRCHF